MADKGYIQIRINGNQGNEHVFPNGNEGVVVVFNGNEGIVSIIKDMFWIVFL